MSCLHIRSITTAIQGLLLLPASHWCKTVKIYVSHVIIEYTITPKIIELFDVKGFNNVHKTIKVTNLSLFVKNI